jgi:hypothetical protein
MLDQYEPELNSSGQILMQISVPNFIKIDWVVLEMIYKYANRHTDMAFQLYTVQTCETYLLWIRNRILF